MKWLLIILPLVLKRLVHFGNNSNNPILELKNFLAKNAMKFFIALAIASAVGTLLSSGIILTVLTLAAQYDAGTNPRFTAILVGSLGIIFASLILLSIAIAFYQSFKRRENKKQKNETNNIGPSLEEVLMLLVNDFIHEKELKRSHFTDENDHQTRSNFESSEIHKEEVKKH